MQWYYLLQGQRQGPIDDAGLEALVRQGTVRDETLVWREGLTEWHAYGAVKPRPAPAPLPRPEPPKTEPAVAKSEPVLAKAEPAASKLETAAPKLEPAAPKLEPAAPKSEPTAPSFEPTTPRPEPAKPRREPGWPEALPFPDSPPPRPTAPAAVASLKTKWDAGRLLDSLAQGRVIRKIVVVVLKIAAVIAGLAGILGALSILTVAFHGNVAAALGGILFTVVVLATSFCVGQICWHRSKTVAALPYNFPYVVIPIFSVLSRAAGEAAAAGLSGIGLGACLSLWLSSGDSAQMFAGLPMLSQFPAEGGFLTGLMVLVYLAGSGFFALIAGYLWAECIMLLLDIERNTRRSV